METSRLNAWASDAEEEVGVDVVEVAAWRIPENTLSTTSSTSTSRSNVLTRPVMDEAPWLREVRLLIFEKSSLQLSELVFKRLVGKHTSYSSCLAK